MQRIRAVIEARRLSRERCSPLIFGNFVELGLARQASGMWAEMLYNRTFRSPPPLTTRVWEWLRITPDRYGPQAPYWHSGYEENDWEPLDTEGTELFRTHGYESWKGEDSLGVRNTHSPREAGIRQRGIYLREGESYRLTLFGCFRGRKTTDLAGEPERAPDGPPAYRDVTVTLRPEAAPAQPLVRRTLSLIATQRCCETELTVHGFTGRATIEVAFDWPGEIALSWCSLMPAESQRGWRSDVVELLKRVGPTAIRFPGGCFASFYDWRDGVGPRGGRRVRESYFWGRLEENDVGIDELIDLCGMLGAEPQICVNMMTGSPWAAADLVEYCNGSEETRMGRMRRSFGISRTRGVKLWEMDNEAGRKWSALQYAEEVRRYALAMRSVDPSITIMMEYYSWGIEWLPRMLEVAGGDVDVVIHRDNDPAFLARALAEIRAYNSRHGTSIRQANTEWLPSWNWTEPFDDPEVPQLYDWEPSGNDYRKTLSFRQSKWFYALNAAATLLDYLSLGGEFLLANYNNCVNTWGANVVESCKEGAWISPAGRMFELFRGDESAYPLETATHGAEPSEAKLLACETQSGGICLYAVNRGKREIALETVAPEGYRMRGGRTLHAAGPLVTNDIGHDRISAEDFGPAEEIRLRPYSVTRLLLARE